MSPRGVSRRAVLGLFPLAAVGAAVSGCGLDSGSAVPLAVAPGSIRPVPELVGVSFTVGSKEFTEQRILGYIAEFALVAAGAHVRDLTNIVGSSSARQAMVSGQIDLMWDYTGSSWISYNGRADALPDAVEQYEAVRDLDRGQGIGWTALSLGAENTYAFALNRPTAERLGVRTLSDLAELTRRNPAEATFCVESEFASRNDGMPGVTRAYGFRVPSDRLHMLSSGTIYQATAMGRPCNFGEVYTTDGRIRALDLVVLDDDRRFFPRYNLALELRLPLLRRYPQITDVFTPIAQRLDNDELRAMNARVDVDGADHAEVARDWMVRQGFVTESHST